MDTDIYPYRFENCDMQGNQFKSLVPGCPLDFDYNIHYKDVFQENLVGQVTMIPGTMMTSFFLDRIGRARTMSTCLARCRG